MESDGHRASGQDVLAIALRDRLALAKPSGVDIEDIDREDRSARITGKGGDELAEEGVDVAMLKAKSRHPSLRSLERYVQPSEASVARLTADHDPARRSQRR